MDVDEFSRSLPLLFGLLTFIALELILLIAALLPLAISELTAKARRPASGGEARNPQRGLASNIETSRIEVVLIAPELVDAVRNLRMALQPQVQSGPQGQVAPADQLVQKKVQLEQENQAVVRERGLNTAPARAPIAARERTLVLVSLSGNREEKTRIGIVKPVGDPAEGLYHVEVKAPVARDLVFDIAKRVGLVQQLRADLAKYGNNEDPLQLVLQWGPLGVNSPALMDPEVDELEFSIDLLPVRGECKTATLNIDYRTRPATVSIREDSTLGRRSK